MGKRRAWILGIAALLLVGGGSYAIYDRWLAQAEGPASPALQTGTVTRGDIVITANGSGELVPADEVELAFRAGGTLDEVLVQVGDQVQADDLLACLETDDLERAVAEADVELQIAQLELAAVQAGPSEAEMADAQAALRDAQVELRLAQAAYENTFDSQLDAAANSRKTDRDWWVGYYQAQEAAYEEGRLSQADRDWAMAAMIAAEGRWQTSVNQAQNEELQAANRVFQASNTVEQAQENLRLLESEPLTDTLAQAILAVDQALLARERMVADLEAAQLYAPFDGVVMDITATAGEQVGSGSPVLTLANLQEPLVRFWVEETDLGSIAAGHQVSVVFDAWPDDLFSGEIIRVYPVLVTVDGTSAVQAWASLDLGARPVSLLSGMTADVEIIAAETREALLVPVEALHELAEGQYAVFVVDPDGNLEMRTVEVGLSDPAYVEILSGLQLGEVVSTGETE